MKKKQKYSPVLNFLCFSTDGTHKNSNSRQMFDEFRSDGVLTPMRLGHQPSSLALRRPLGIQPLVFPSPSASDLSRRLSLKRPLQLSHSWESLQNVSSSVLRQVAQTLQLPQTLKKEANQIIQLRVSVNVSSLSITDENFLCLQ